MHRRPARAHPRLNHRPFLEPLPPMRRLSRSSLSVPACIAALLVAVAAPAGAADYLVQIHGQVTGKLSLQAGADGTTVAEYAYSERGRGDQIRSTWSLGADGLPARYAAQGHDYWNVALKEEFERADGRARWINRVDHGDQSAAAPAFYLPANPPPEFTGVLARALLKAPGHRLALLPSGEARLAFDRTVDATAADGRAHRLSLYQISGIDFVPMPVWLDEQGETVAVLNDWLEVVRDAYAGDAEALRAAQNASLQSWNAELARRTLHEPQGGLLIRHARLFDPRDGRVRDDMSVLVRGERIVAVDRDALLHAAPDAEVLDAAGRMLLPGLWDVHQHFSGVDGAFNLIAGVTSARDLANDNLPLIERVKRFDAGTELGPRVVLGGIVEGTGPLAGPTDVRVDSAEKAHAAVDWYYRHGYAQIKIYSSFPPELVQLIAEDAHRHGMRVSGHVPAFMTARQFIQAGSDEIQHLNFIVLNFFDDVGDTRGPQRYTIAAEKIRQLRLDDPRWAEFVGFMQQHHTVLDPTMVALEGLFSGDPSQVAPALLPVIDRFPPLARRTLLSGAVPVPAGHEQAYREALPALQRMLLSLYRSGITLMPGSDSFSGYSLHRDLELWVQAGIPNAEVLRMATLVPAQVLGVDRDRGVVAPGKLADMVLVDGDPTRRIGDIRNVWRTIKGGRVIDPQALEEALGLSRRATAPAR